MIAHGDVWTPKVSLGAVMLTDTFVAPRNVFRRVIAVREGQVIYNDGGDLNYQCSVLAFERWCKTHNAINTRNDGGFK